ncbi:MULTISPECIES: isochorismatase family protein [unclassified Thalassolituus]|uniref:isochorismatase family protein n=1 Tax=unclassified Thalassolituus TaxID=2624967 RepID=UPI0025E69DAA|nr:MULTISPECIES: isochorismatase family protein [unclassified Thalassolituus]|tara:strand:- start:389 stop:1036 length:648 start_codon:yes stop_codon:yes gene_type:complete
MARSAFDQVLPIAYGQGSHNEKIIHNYKNVALKNGGHMLNSGNTGLMIVDVQGRLSTLMHDSESLFRQLRILISGAKVLQLPVIWMEQLPDKLGPTRAEIRDLLDGEPYVKNTFSGLQNDAIAAKVKELNMANWLVAGLEAHVCVYQSVCDLLQQHAEVHLVTDAVSSRTQANRDLAINKMAAMGAQLTSTEMALFELQKVAEGEQFKRLINVLK